MRLCVCLYYCQPLILNEMFIHTYIKYEKLNKIFEISNPGYMNRCLLLFDLTKGVIIPNLFNNLWWKLGGIKKYSWKTIKIRRKFMINMKYSFPKWYFKIYILLLAIPVLNLNLKVFCLYGLIVKKGYESSLDFLD